MILYYGCALESKSEGSGEEVYAMVFNTDSHGHGE